MGITKQVVSYDDQGNVVGVGVSKSSNTFGISKIIPISNNVNRIFPVKVYNPDGSLKHIIPVEDLVAMLHMKPEAKREFLIKKNYLK